MTVGQQVPLELVALDGPAGGFTDAPRCGRARRRHRSFPGSTARGCWSSADGNRPRAAPASRADRGRAARHPRSVPGRRSNHPDRRRSLRDPGAGRGRPAPGFRLAGPPALLGWATGNLPSRRNNPQIGMANMRTICPRSRRPARPRSGRPIRIAWPCPRCSRDTRIVKDMPPKRSRGKSPSGLGGLIWRLHNGVLSFSSPNRTGRMASRRRARALNAARALGGAPCRRVRREAGPPPLLPGRDCRILRCGRALAQSRYATDAAAAEALVRAAAPRSSLRPAPLAWTRGPRRGAARWAGRHARHACSIGRGASALAGFTASASKPCSHAASGLGFCCSIRLYLGHAPGEPHRRSRRRGDCYPANPPSSACARQSEEQTIRPDAELLFVAGAGWTKKQNDGQPHVEKPANSFSVFSREPSSLGPPSRWSI